MFSDINKIRNLVKTPPPDARAEQSDSRQEMIRHDPEQERQKKKGKFKEARSIFGDDLANVSVATLDIFLKNILVDFTDKPGDEKDPVAVSPPAGQSENPNAAAAGAYARTAAYDSAPHAPPPEPESAADPEESLQHPTLSSQDVQLVYRLQKDIDELKRRGIESVRFEENGSFLESLEQAVKKALH
jgi:hypothetical protein